MNTDEHSHHAQHHHHDHHHGVHSHHHHDDHFRQSAWNHLDQLTKPPKSLGIIEELAADICAIQNSHHPHSTPRTVMVFAADHGICDEGVSAYPQSVTTQMVHNMATGGACVSVLSKLYQAELKIVDVGCLQSVEGFDNIINKVIRQGTRNFLHEPAMTIKETTQAMKVGSELVAVEIRKGTKIMAFGEMGIGNTTSASALAAWVLNQPAHKVVGPGTGITTDQMEKKARLIDQALALHRSNMKYPVQSLACVGGLEIAALVGAIVQAAQHQLVVVIDGLICTAAAAIASMLSHDVKPALIASHASSEPGHKQLLNFLDKKPLLEFNMRLGEASGALLALPVLDATCAIYNEMATFDSAGVDH